MRKICSELDGLVELFYEMFPGAPKGVGSTIISYSYRHGRVMYSSDLTDQKAVVYATIAWVRHNMTDYEKRLAQSPAEKHQEIKREANRQVGEILGRWKSPSG